MEIPNDWSDVTSLIRFLHMYHTLYFRLVESEVNRARVFDIYGGLLTWESVARTVTRITYSNNVPRYAPFVAYVCPWHIFFQQN